MQKRILYWNNYLSKRYHLPLLSPRRRGRPESLNVMIYSLVLGKMEHMIYTKDIVRRLKDSLEFAIRCRFTELTRFQTVSRSARSPCDC